MTDRLPDQQPIRVHPGYSVAVLAVLTITWILAALKMTGVLR
jgi:hypothetical protein